MPITTIKKSIKLVQHFQSEIRELEESLGLTGALIVIRKDEIDSLIKRDADLLLDAARFKLISHRNKLTSLQIKKEILLEMLSISVDIHTLVN